jgi:hypothetical protein
MFIQNPQASKCKNCTKSVHIIVYKLLSFIFMMSWYEVHTIYILTKSMQLS